MRGRSAVAVAALSIVKLQPEVGFLPVILQGHRGVIGLFRFLRPAAGQMQLALVQQSGGGILVKILLLGGEKAVILPEGEPAGGIFAEKALLALGDVAAAPGAGADSLLPGREQDLAARNGGARCRQLPHHSGDGLHEVLRGQLPMLHLFQPVLPLCRQQRGLQLLRQDGNEGIALLGGHQMGDLLGLPALHKASGHQLFQDTGTGGGCPDAPALHILRHILHASRFHRGQQRIFR